MLRIFEFYEYKSYLRKVLDERTQSQRGTRSRFAEAIGCRSGYVTQILNGKSDLSLDQADAASEFLEHTDEESQYFLLLVIRGRAGTNHLKERIESQLKRRRDNYLNLKKRFRVQSISKDDQMVFYSSWHYLAILTLLGVPKYRNIGAISNYLHLPFKRISEALEQLHRSGLILFKDGTYHPGINRTHLGSNSPMIFKHHLNWRIQALHSIERQSEQDLHYSSVVSLSKKDMHLVKSRLVEMLENIARIVGPSREERVCSFCVDFFEIGY